MRRITAK